MWPEGKEQDTLQTTEVRAKSVKTKSILMKGCQDVVENTLLHFLFWCMQMVQKKKESLKCCGFQSMKFVHADCQSLPQKIVETYYKVIGLKSL